MKQNVGAPVGMGTWGHVNAIFGCHLNPIPAKKTDYAHQILMSHQVLKVTDAPAPTYLQNVKNYVQIHTYIMYKKNSYF